MNYPERHPDLTAFVLGGLDPEESEETRRHLSSCPRCRNELEGVQKVNRALVAPPPVDPPDYLKDEILTRLRAERESHSEPEKPFSSGGQTKSPKALRFRLLSGVAAAAVVAVVALGIFFGLPRAEAPVATVALVPTPEGAAGLEGYWGGGRDPASAFGQPAGGVEAEQFRRTRAGQVLRAVVRLRRQAYQRGLLHERGKGVTWVWLNAPPGARSFDTLLITEERLDGEKVSGTEVALEGKMP
jgi:hypothetical protein